MSKIAQNRITETGGRVLAGLLLLAGLIFLGCANDPVSRKRIAERNAAVDKRIESIRRAESRHPERLDRTMRDISRDKERKKVEYRETMRTIGDRFW